MFKSQKLLVCGYSHCGTTILKSIIGHIEDVEEIIDECKSIKKSTNKKYILCKYPQAESSFFSEGYKDYIKIFIIRNPLYVFSSINKRYGHYKLSEKHSIEGYIGTVKLFIKYKNNPEKDIYTIKYEELFKNNFEELKKIFDDIGFKYDDRIFDNSKYTNKSHSDVKLVNNKPKNKEHKLYRNWQINQPFECLNDISKTDLNEEQIEQLVNDPDILELYPDINS
tara:strand:- start:7034 stop:7705 length:672 start_codon:yes stop_codon:yes gene_type:complete